MDDSRVLQDVSGAKVVARYYPLKRIGLCVVRGDDHEGSNILGRQVSNLIL